MTVWTHAGSLWQLDQQSPAAEKDFECPDLFKVPGASARGDVWLLKWGLGPLRSDYAVLGTISDSRHWSGW